MSILCCAYEFERKVVLVSHRTSPLDFEKLDFEKQPLLRNPVDFLVGIKSKEGAAMPLSCPFLISPLLAVMFR
jgi:hypothetical protein